MLRRTYQLFSARDIDDQRILKSDSPMGTPGYTQPRVFIVNVTFLNKN